MPGNFRPVWRGNNSGEYFVESEGRMVWARDYLDAANNPSWGSFDEYARDQSHFVQPEPLTYLGQLTDGEIMYLKAPGDKK